MELLACAALPYLCLIGTIWHLRLADSGRDDYCLAAAINGSLIWCGLILSTAWLASPAHWLGASLIRSFWLLYASVLALLLFRQRKKFSPPSIHGPIPWLLLAICGANLFVGLVYPNSMWDVLAYHLPRAMHWLQNHSVFPYPASDPRQIGMAPLNALIAMQSLAFEQGDYFVNLGQWLAFCGMILGVMQIARQLGGGKKAQLCAGLFLATLPTAITQAANAESCNIVTFWTLAFAALFLDWLRKPGRAIACKCGLCLGLAILSKGSAYPIALPFAMAVLFFCLARPRKLFLQGLLAGGLAMAVIAPQLVMNYAASGRLFYGGEKNILTRPTAGSALINLAYNFLSHEPWLLKGPLLNGWKKMEEAAGADRPDILKFGGAETMRRDLAVYTDESEIQNVVQALFLLWLALAIIFRKFKPPALYTLLVGCSFACFIIFLTWHPWVGRIHTTLFALAAPLAGMYMAGWQKAWPRDAFCGLMLAWAFFLFIWSRKPLNIFDYENTNFLYNSRESLYFNNYWPYRAPYLKMVKYLAGQKDLGAIGLRAYEMAFEYPLWRLLRDYGRPDVKIRHLTAPGDVEKLKPDYIVELGKGNETTPLAMPRLFKRIGGEYAEIAF